MQKSLDDLTLPFIRTAYDGSNVAASNASAIFFDEKIEPSLTKQAFVKECDINTILAQFAKTGVISHINQNAPKYIDMAVLPTDYHEACNLVFAAHEMFLDLPAAVRDRFENDPEKLLAFLADDANYDEAVRLGLVEPPPAVEGDVEAPAAPVAGGTPPQPSTPPGAPGGGQNS